MRNGDGWFASGELAAHFERLHVPGPRNLSQCLANLERRGLTVRRRTTPRNWSLTPRGRELVRVLVGQLDYGMINAELAGTPGAEFAHGQHATLDPVLAPLRWSHGISRMLERFPFETNVFCMTRFPSEDDPGGDPLETVIASARSACENHGLTMHLALERQFEDDLLGNVGAYMWSCQYGIGLLEARSPDAPGLNSNVLIELGAMLMAGRRCAILRDHTSPEPPADIAAQIYKAVDFDNTRATRDLIHRWISEDLGLGRCNQCPS